MGCHTPECMGEHAAGTISHSVVYRERTIVLHHVPADVCPECGDAVLSEETTVVIDDLLRRKTTRSKKTVFLYEA
jgi:YgiT-type zinc finger domain-containing protein